MTYHEETGDHPQLELYSKGDWVSYAQQLLDSQGFPPQDHKIDGFFGPMTQEAVRDFQGSHGLKVDGIIGPITWAALEGRGGGGGGGGSAQLEFADAPKVESSGWVTWTVRNTGQGTAAANSPAGSYEMYKDNTTIPGDQAQLAEDLAAGAESGQIGVNLTAYTPDDGTYQVSVQVGNNIHYLDYVVENGQARPQ